MTHLIHHVYTFDNEYETVLDFSDPIIVNDDDIDNDLNSVLPILPDLDQTDNLRNYTSQLSHWRPSTKLQKLYDRFYGNNKGRFLR